LLASNRLNINYEPKTGDIDFDFDFVKPIDAGVYKCRAENIYGQDNTFGNIFIIDVPNIDERPQYIDPESYKYLSLPLPNYPTFDRYFDPSKGKPPKFIIHLPYQYKYLNGENVLLKCRVEGYPLPKVS
jgi:hypothetical protein